MLTFKFHSTENNKSQSLTQKSSNKALRIVYIQTIYIKCFLKRRDVNDCMESVI